MITTNTGAKIIEGSDNWREIFPNGSDPGAHNASVLAHDAGIEGLQEALGIVVDGDQAAVSASKGQYIILKNSTITGCTDGLYTATKAIPANTSIDNTYLSAVSGGGLNALNTQLTPVSVNITRDTSAWSGNETKCFKIGSLVIALVYIIGTPTNGATIATGLPIPKSNRDVKTAMGSPANIVAVAGNTGTLYISSPGTTSNAYIGGVIVYAAAN